MSEHDSASLPGDGGPSPTHPFPPATDRARDLPAHSFEYTTSEGSADAIVNGRWHVRQQTRDLARERLLISERGTTVDEAVLHSMEDHIDVNTDDIFTWVFETDPESAGKNRRHMAWKFCGLLLIERGTNKQEWYWYNPMTQPGSPPELCPPISGELRALVHDFTSVPALVPQSTEPPLDLEFTYRDQPVDADGYVDAPAYTDYIYEPVTVRPTALPFGATDGGKGVDTDDQSTHLGGIVDARYIVISDVVSGLVGKKFLDEAGSSGHRLLVIDPYVTRYYYEDGLGFVSETTQALYHEFLRLDNPDPIAQDLLTVDDPGPVWLLTRVGGMDMTNDGREIQSDIYNHTEHYDLRPPIRQRLYPLVASFTGEAVASPDLYVGYLADRDADPVVKFHPTDPIVTDAG